MSRFEKGSIWVTSFLTVATGVGYFVTKYLFTPADPYAVVNHPLQPLFLKAHIVVSPLLLFALGLITVRHVWRHFRTGVEWSRKSGITAAVAVIPMVLTGYLIQVLTDAGWVRAMALSHIAFGFLYAVGIAAHSWVIRLTEPPGNGVPSGRADDLHAGTACREDAAGPGAEGRGEPTLRGRSSSAPGRNGRRPDAGAREEGGSRTLKLSAARHER